MGDPEDTVDWIMTQWRTQRPDLDPSPMGVVGRLTRAARLFERELGAHFAEHGLQGYEFDILATLRRAGPPYRLSAGALVQASMVTSGAVTHRIDRLLDRGLVTRETDPDSRRRVLISLTEAGRDLVDRVAAAHFACEERLVASLPPPERAQLAALLRRLLVDFDDVPGAGPTPPSPSAGPASRRSD